MWSQPFIGDSLLLLPIVFLLLFSELSPAHSVAAVDKCWLSSAFPFEKLVVQHLSSHLLAFSRWNCIKLLRFHHDSILPFSNSPIKVLFQVNIANDAECRCTTAAEHNFWCQTHLIEYFVDFLVLRGKFVYVLLSVKSQNIIRAPTLVRTTSNPTLLWIRIAESEKKKSRN